MIAVMQAAGKAGRQHRLPSLSLSLPPAWQFPLLHSELTGASIRSISFCGTPCLSNSAPSFLALITRVVVSFASLRWLGHIWQPRSDPALTSPKSTAAKTTEARVYPDCPNTCFGRAQSEFDTVELALFPTLLALDGAGFAERGRHLSLGEVPPRRIRRLRERERAQRRRRLSRRG